MDLRAHWGGKRRWEAVVEGGIGTLGWDVGVI